MLRRLAFVSAILVSFAACKQGEGEFCQVNDDCDDGLVCAQITDTCEKSASPNIDAGPDAEPADAEVPDANPPLPQCSDGVDNDGDLLTDFGGLMPDPECTSALDDDETL